MDLKKIGHEAGHVVGSGLCLIEDFVFNNVHVLCN
jgi:hypothetical protein